ncbi:NAD(P)-binding domain-containing protein [Solwaraspora sp. WMMD792]|uniref:NAD(P)-binding domain-containing protein n=1 Tax=Solwaraspora sp. WMMD792 TaxID=3016099 RepID=UPI002416BC7A|nr:NAD(P)-binding domain-containing protein [Solwaraspora sp. WMMD792]MDG4770968.1 NAD-binding protein [Solwaraspora sp. WMMD792]
METFETARLDRYFRAVTHTGNPVGADTRSLVITHLLADRPPFIRAVDRITPVAGVLPKPKSVHRAAARTVGLAYSVDELSRDRFTDPDAACAYLEQRAAGQAVVLLDVGGYFAPVLAELCDRFSGRILGVVEDTENGHRRYLELGKPPCAVYSVARSPLKQSEDHLVGQSIVFSTEALMRSRGDILPGRAATVVGFGKLGSSIARTLHAKGVRVTVYDADPVRATQALAQGFHVAASRPAALATAGMVMCATGNLALRGEDFTGLANGAYLASVTSSEDELELDTLTGVYEQSVVAEHVIRYTTIGHYFYLLASGNAVNFLHGASVGAFIFLVQAEILAAAARCASGEVEPGYHEVPEADRRRIAEIWLAHFNPPGAHR